MGDTWYLDELFVKIQGRQQYLWRAVDEDGDVIDILVQSRRNQRAAIRFFRKLLKSQDCVPRRLMTDKLRSYPAALRTVMPSVVHCTEQYANNRAEVSHEPTRQRERQMRRFKSAAHAQRFLSVQGPVLNLFRVGRHLLQAVHHRLLRTRSTVLSGGQVSGRRIIRTSRGDLGSKWGERCATSEQDGREAGGGTRRLAGGRRLGEIHAAGGHLSSSALNPSPTSGRMDIFTPIGVVVLGGRGCSGPAYVSSLSWLSLAA